MNLYSKLIYFALQFLFLQVICEGYEYNNINVDGLLLEPSESDFYKILKQVDYSAIFLYTKMNERCTNLLSIFKNSAKQIVNFSPAVGVFKIRCIHDDNENNYKICEEVKIISECELIFIFLNNFKILNINSEQNLVDKINKIIYQTSVTLLDSKTDIKNINKFKFAGFLFFTIFSQNNTDFEGKLVKLNNFYENSIFLKSYKAFVIKDKEIFKYLFKYFQKYTSFIIKENSFFNFDISNLEPTQDQEINYITITNNNENFISTINYDIENIQQNENIASSVLFLSLPYIINYKNSDTNFSLIYNSDISHHFLLIYEKGDDSILKRYEYISKKFRQMNMNIWFTYMETESNNDLGIEDISILPVVFYYENFQNSGKENMISFEKEDIEYNKLFKFINSKLQYKDQSLTQENSKKMELIEYSSNLVYDENFIIYFYNIYSDNLNIDKKWVFLLETANYLINSNKINLKFFKYNILENKSLLNFPADVFKLEKNKNIFLYLNQEKSINYIKGPSIQYFFNFINESLNLNFKLKEEHIQNFFEEIFYNQDYMEDVLLEEGEIDEIIQQNKQILNMIEDL